MRESSPIYMSIIQGQLTNEGMQFIQTITKLLARKGKFSLVYENLTHNRKVMRWY